MKKIQILLLLAGLVFSMLSMAQTPYRSYFGRDFTNWYDYNEFYDIFRYSELIKVEGQDTILSNGSVYKYTKKFWSPDQEEYSFYFCGMREDTITGSLYLCFDGSNDVLLSRMNLAVADTFYFSKDTRLNEFENILENENGYYTLIDSVYFKEGRKYVQCDAVFPRYFSFGEQYPLTFIEGIGPNVSFSVFSSDPGFSSYFICYETEAGLWQVSNEFWRDILHHEPEPECFFDYRAVGIPDTQASLPFQVISRVGFLEVQFDPGKLIGGAVSLYSAQGQLLETKETNGAQTVTIATKGIPSGSYILRVTDQETKQSFGKKVVLK